MVCPSVLDFCTRSCFWFGWPAGGEDRSLEPPWNYANTRGSNGAKIGLVWGFLKFSFGSCAPAYRAPA